MIEPITLIVDTSLWGCALALVMNGQLTRYVDATLGADGALNTRLQDLAHDAGLKHLSDVQRVFVSVGPGSFTGIRSGLGWTYGFMRARAGLKIAAASSLAASARELAHSQGLEHLRLHMPMSRMEMIEGVLTPSHFTASIVPAVSGVDDGKTWVVEPVPSLQSVYATLHGTRITRFDIMDLGLKGMAKDLRQTPDEAWVTEPFAPEQLLYLKKSSAEERQQKTDGGRHG